MSMINGVQYAQNVQRQAPQQIDPAGSLVGGFSTGMALRDQVDARKEERMKRKEENMNKKRSRELVDAFMRSDPEDESGRQGILSELFSTAGPDAVTALTNLSDRFNQTPRERKAEQLLAQRRGQAQALQVFKSLLDVEPEQRPAHLKSSMAAFPDTAPMLTQLAQRLSAEGREADMYTADFINRTLPLLELSILGTEAYQARMEAEFAAKLESDKSLNAENKLLLEHNLGMLRQNDQQRHEAAEGRSDRRSRERIAGTQAAGRGSGSGSGGTNPLNLPYDSLQEAVLAAGTDANPIHVAHVWHHGMDDLRVVNNYGEDGNQHPTYYYFDEQLNIGQLTATPSQRREAARMANAPRPGDPVGQRRAARSGAAAVPPRVHELMRAADIEDQPPATAPPATAPPAAATGNVIDFPANAVNMAGAEPGARNLSAGGVNMNALAGDVSGFGLDLPDISDDPAIRAAVQRGRNNLLRQGR